MGDALCTFVLHLVVHQHDDIGQGMHRCGHRGFAHVRAVEQHSTEPLLVGVFEHLAQAVNGLLCCDGATVAAWGDSTVGVHPHAECVIKLRISVRFKVQWSVLVGCDGAILAQFFTRRELQPVLFLANVFPQQGVHYDLHAVGFLLDPRLPASEVRTVLLPNVYGFMHNQ